MSEGAPTHGDAEPILMAWSGGKDSAMALQALQRDPSLRIAALLTTVTEGYERISMHGVRRALLVEQADSLGLALEEVRIPSRCVNADYEAAMARVLGRYYEQGVRRVAFGDLFLEDIRRYREANLARIGMTGLFPLWGRDTRKLAQRFIEEGFRARLVCIDPQQLHPLFCGREFDWPMIADLPATVDPCGERGEFHTFVYDGPIFRRRIAVTTGETVERDGFVFCDLRPASPEAPVR